MLTYLEEKTLYEIDKHINLKGYPSTVRELCQLFSLKSPATMHQRLGKLIDKGYIKRDPGSPRAITILKAVGE